MVGVIAVYLVILQTSFISSAHGGLTCPDGITSFSHGVRSNSYYACEEGNGQPVLKTCAHGMFYWAYKKACFEIQNAVKTEHTDLKIYTRPILGDPVFLGDLYNSNTDEVLTGYSFWDADTILKHKKRMVSPSSTVDIYVTRSTIDRLQRADSTSSLKLDVLGDIIAAEGSAQYFKDRLESENEAAVILSYQATTHTETIPVLTPKDDDLCGVSGPTHVITSVMHGIGANFVFKKPTGDGESREEVERVLKRAVHALSTTKTDITDSIKEITKDVRVKFFADFVSEKQPTSYQESAHMYASLSHRIGKHPSNDTVTMKMKVMPITNFCEGKKTTHIAISDDILNSVSKMLSQLEATRLTINTIKMEKAVRTYLPLMDILQALADELDTFEVHMKTELRILLPRIRRGNSSEEALILLLNKYHKSPFRQDNVRTFLRNRRREVTMLNFIANPQKIQETDIEVISYDEASDIRTMFIKPFVLMFRYNILPSRNMIQKFIKGEVIDESKNWYNNPYVISAMGIQFNKFVHFSSANKNSKTRGYLLAISDAKEANSNDVIDDVININAQKEGLLYTFKFPSIPPKMISPSKTHESIKFTVTHPASTWVTGYEISYWIREQQKDVTSQMFQFSQNVTTAIVEKLLPGTRYHFSMQYVTPMGSSPPCATTSFYTRPCSPPTNLRVSILAANHVRVDWDAPSTCGKSVRIANYRITVTGEAKFSKTITVDSVTKVEVKRLKPASNYVFSIEAITDKQTSNGTAKNVILTTLPSTISFITLPEAPSHVSLANRSIHSAVIVWDKPVKVAAGGIIEKYRIKYTMTNNIGNIEERGTEMTITSLNTNITLTDLSQGTSYAVSVQVLTSKGDSDYSTNLLITTMFVKSELDYLRDSLNHSVATIEAEIGKRKDEVHARFNNTDTTMKAISNIPSLMVYYPRLRFEKYLIDRVSGCGGTINTAGYLRYPPNPPYKPNEDCSWDITTGLPTTVTFRYIMIFCEYNNYVTVYDEELLIGKYCGQSNPAPIHTHSGNVHMKFHSDGRDSGWHGFHVTISVTDTKRMAAQRYYPKYKATFTGYGSPKSYSEHHTWNLPKSNSSIPLCIQECNERFVNDKTWSEMSIEMNTDPLQCACYKNPVGFVYSLSKFQYRMS